MTPTRDELDQEAVDLGLDPSDYDNKDDLQAAIDQAQPNPAVGPAAEPPAPSSRKAAKMFRPENIDDVPEALR